HRYQLKVTFLSSPICHAGALIPVDCLWCPEPRADCWSLSRLRELGKALPLPTLKAIRLQHLGPDAPERSGIPPPSYTRINWSNFTLIKMKFPVGLDLRSSRIVVLSCTFRVCSMDSLFQDLGL